MSALVVAGLALVGCQKHAVAHKAEHPAEVQPIRGSSLKKVILTEGAAKRLDVGTAKVWEEGGETLVPYSSLIYDPKGKVWVYTSSAPRTFVRQEVEVVRIQGDRVVVKVGPPPGTMVASRAVAELYGTELAVGH
jgi:hypothetical protein